jgi:two-component system, cell cycle sensor histidine kinase and response regulator CckA
MGQAAKDQTGDGLRLPVLLANFPGLAYRCRHDSERTMEFVSQGCLPLTGYAPEELLGNAAVSYASLIDPDDRDSVLASIARAVDMHESYAIHYRIHPRDEGLKWVFEQGRGVFSEAGHLLALEGLAVDTTAQRGIQVGIERRDQILEAVNRGAAVLLNSSDWDDGLTGLLERIGVAVGATRAYVFGNERLEDGRVVSSLTHEWCRPGAPSELGNPLLVRGPYGEYLGRWASLLSAGAEVCGNTRDFPEREQIPLRSLGIRSVLVVPVSLAGEWLGFVGLDDCDGERTWPPSDVDALRTVASLIGAAIGRREAERALRESERRYRLVAENATDVIWTLDAETLELKYVSPSAGRLRGYSPEEVVRQALSERVRAEDLQHLVARFRERRERLEAGDEAARTGAYTVRQPTRDGGEIAVEMAVTLVTDGSGRVVEVLGVSRDVTDRVRAEERLRESEESYRALVENLPDIVMRTDSEGKPIYVSPSVQEVAGVAPEFLIGRSWREMGAPEPLAGQLAAILDRVFEAGQAGHEEIRVDWGGGVRFFDWRLVPERDAQGEARSVLSIARDITGLRQAEESQRLAAIGQLAAGVAHDFNNLLAAMSIAGELAQASQEEDDYRSLCETVRMATLRGADLCRNLMAYARPSAPCREGAYLEDIADGALRLASLQLESSGIAVALDYDPRPVAILLDSGQLEQVLLNLVINACHAMPQGGQLTIATRYEDGAQPWARLLVTDTGVGIPHANLERVFEPFFTTKGPLGQSETPGTGLGLSVSSSIVAAHGGTLRVQSEIGLGSTFTISLPTEPAAAVRSRRPQSPPQGAGSPDALRGRAILVVDDEETIRAGISRVLEGVGARSTLAASTDAGLAALGAARFDVVLTDLMMPGGGAQAILAATRAMDRGPQVVVITGRIEHSVAEELLAAGARACIAKPFRRRELLDALVDALDAS